MKCVLVIDRALPLGLIANTAAVLSLSLSRKVDGLLGTDVTDGSGLNHAGITRLPVPALGADAAFLGTLRARLQEEAFRDVDVVGFTATAQSCKTYDEYIGKMAVLPSSDLTYLGIAMHGPRAKVTQLTGSLPLLK